MGGFNVHFIERGALDENVEACAAGEGAHHSNLILEASRDTIIMPGDRALVCRVPDRETGRSTSILSDELLDPLLNEDEFRTRLGLQDAQAWKEWRERCKRHTNGLAQRHNSCILSPGTLAAVNDEDNRLGRKSGRASTDPGSSAIAAQLAAAELGARAVSHATGE